MEQNIELVVLPLPSLISEFYHKYHIQFHTSSSWSKTHIYFYIIQYYSAFLQEAEGDIHGFPFFILSSKQQPCEAGYGEATQFATQQSEHLNYSLPDPSLTF